ncbi:MAG: transglutaminase family protein [Chloroflexia bacterium]|nr:transglutaminase family protein [Chloroflexia bacterium]
MRYRITHRTAYTYAPPAYESFNEVRLRPVSDGMQTCVGFNLAIDPPATVIAFEDYYGNSVHDFGIPYLHDRLCIEATSDVITFAGVGEHLTGPREGEVDRSPVLVALAQDEYFADENAEFLHPSAYVALGRSTEKITEGLLAATPEMSAYGFLLGAAAYVHDHFEYRVGATNVRSTVEDLLQGGSGVCQDFSHLLISLCRHAGLPARYVSGYLGNVSASAASHAWAEAFVPPYGWVGIDPTAGTPSTGRHVKVAVGRDYADVSVVRGTYRGGAASGLEVSVACEVVGDSQSLGIGAPARSRVGPIQFQTLGAMRQLQRLEAMTQSLGAMVQTLAPMGSMEMDDPFAPGSDDRSPRQQPQQQQQTAGEGA